jgi:hypothetical protein
MKLVYFLVAITLPLFSAGALAAELDDITLEVIDARASSVDDVMRNIEIPDYDRQTGHEAGSQHPMAAERGRHRSEAHGEDRRDGAEESHADHRRRAEETHDEARDAIEEAHEEAGEEHEDAHDDAEEAHDDSTEEIEDIEIPESVEDSESHDTPESHED